MVSSRAMGNTNEYKRIPAIDRVLGRLPPGSLGAPPMRAHVVSAVREVVAELRERLGSGEDVPDIECTAEALAGAAMERARGWLGGSLRPVVNLTGVILHTNLGRSPLAPEWLDEARSRVAGYCNLEYDVDSRRRGSRNDHAVTLLRRIVPGAEAALVVNNCAAAVLLALTALARGREVVVSRGELVEIGGGFRIPDVMAASGARLVEVGTTNRTRLGDYASAIGPETAALFKAHHSNFRLVGFVEEVDVASLAGLAHEHRLPALLDLGSGLLSDPGVSASEGEPGPQAALAAGADLVCISGDKLLGGPQAGILLGREAVLAPLRSHPLMRALRVDKLTLAILEACLRRHLAGDLDGIPALAALRRTPAEVRRRCGALVRRVSRSGLPEGLSLRVVSTESETGGGTLPARAIPSYGVEVRFRGASEADIDARLRAGVPPILGRLREGAVVLDLRTLLPGQEAVVASALCRLAESPLATGAPLVGGGEDPG